MTAIRETMEEAGYASYEMGENNEVILILPCGAKEVWSINDGHGSYGITLNGHDLEFIRDA